MTSTSNNDDNESESLADLLKRTIREGAPIYNAGNPQGCYDLYLAAAQQACAQPELNRSAVGQLLEQTIEEAQDVATTGTDTTSGGGDYDEAAWVRFCL